MCGGDFIIFIYLKNNFDDCSFEYIYFYLNKLRLVNNDLLMNIIYIYKDKEIF